MQGRVFTKSSGACTWRVVSGVVWDELAEVVIAAAGGLTSRARTRNFKMSLVPVVGTVPGSQTTAHTACAWHCSESPGCARCSCL